MEPIILTVLAWIGFTAFVMLIIELIAKFIHKFFKIPVINTVRTFSFISIFISLGAAVYISYIIAITATLMNLRLEGLTPL